MLSLFIKMKFQKNLKVWHTILHIAILHIENDVGRIGCKLQPFSKNPSPQSHHPLSLWSESKQCKIALGNALSRDR